jgi:hypothetical protein
MIDGLLSCRVFVFYFCYRYMIGIKKLLDFVDSVKQLNEEHRVEKFLCKMDEGNLQLS